MFRRLFPAYFKVLYRHPLYQLRNPREFSQNIQSANRNLNCVSSKYKNVMAKIVFSPFVDIISIFVKYIVCFSPDSVQNF